MANWQAQSYSSRSIDNLDKLILAAQTAEERHLLFARKAGHLARFSCLPEARALVQELRALNAEYEPSLSAWIILAEGLIEHFENLNNIKAKDKFLRALLVGQMAENREVAGIAAAWMAHCELVSGNIRGVVNNITMAFKWSEDEVGEARGRASQVLADALNWAGQSDLARDWYREARKHSVREGDISMQNVMLFNVANFGVANLTLQDCLAPLSSDRWKRVSMEVASAGNLNTALGIQSLSSLIPIMQAELFVIQREWKAALQLFEDNFPKIIAEGQKRLLPKLLAQYAWCHANLGNTVAANAAAKEAVENISDCSDLDDLCVLHFRISASAKLINNTEMVDYHYKQALIVQKQFETHQAEAFAMLDKTIQSIAQTKNPT